MQFQRCQQVVAQGKPNAKQAENRGESVHHGFPGAIRDEIGRENSRQ